MHRKRVRAASSAFVWGFVVVAAVESWAQSGESILGTSVRLSRVTAERSTLGLSVSSPYPNRAFKVFALSPTRAPFVLAEGTTSGAGSRDIELRLRSEPSINGLNLIAYAVVEGEEGGPAVSSPPFHLRLEREAGSGVPGVTFQPDEAPLDETLSPNAAILADIDGDRDQDLVLAGSTEAASLLKLLVNDGEGRFADESEARLGATRDIAARTVSAADVDGDGALDLFVGTVDAETANAVLINDGAGAFTRREGFPEKAAEANRTNHGLFADFDADGDADLFLANGASGAHADPPNPQVNQLLLNDGLGGFAYSDAIDEGDRAPEVSRQAAAGDIDLDGDLDILVANAAGDQLLLNAGAGRFADASDRLPPAGDSTYGVELADVDLDGDLDVVYANTMFNPAAQVILVNQGGEQAGAAGDFAAGEFPPLAAGQSPIRLGLTVADFDGDGDPDILYAIHELGSSERPDLYWNQGGLQGGVAGTFVLDASFAPPTGVYAALPGGDVDGDGDLDIALLPSGAPTGKQVLRNQRFATGDAPLGFQRGDANSDLVFDLSDSILVLGYLFLGGEAPACDLAADVNDDEVVDLSDAVALLNYLFGGGPEPAAPFPGFGDDAAGGSLRCDRVELFE